MLRSSRILRVDIFSSSNIISYIQFDNTQKYI